MYHRPYIIDMRRSGEIVVEVDLHGPRLGVSPLVCGCRRETQEVTETALQLEVMLLGTPE